MEAVRKFTDIPLVLHGCTGMKEEIIKEAIQLGVAKINFGTEIRYKYVEHYEEGLKLSLIHIYIDAYQTLARRSEFLQQSLEEDAKAAFFQLQLYPLRTCADTAAKFIYADKAALYAKQKRGGCVNWYAAESDAAYYLSLIHIFISDGCMEEQN